MQARNPFISHYIGLTASYLLKLIINCRLTGMLFWLNQCDLGQLEWLAGSQIVGPYKAKNALHILKHNQLQSLKGAREEWLQFCWDFVKSPWNDEIALQHFFSCLQQCKNFFSISCVLHAIVFFRQGLAGNFFSKSSTPPPLKS